VLRVTADTNLYISAFNFGGNPARFLRLAQAEVFRLFLSEAILMEVGRVLRRKKFGWPQEQIENAQEQLMRISQCVEPTETLHVITADPTDDRILECAAAAKADYIVSGDKHLLALKSFDGALILKV
jgi:putative PIN family toxin of toxin-antitoxin system